MPKFNYVAMDSRGKETKGTLEVGNQADAINRLKEMGFFPTKVMEAEKPKGGLSLVTRAAAVKGGESGTSLTAGDPAKSPLFTTTTLPTDDEPADIVFAPPYHPYTAALLAAAPRPDPDAAEPDIILGGNAEQLAHRDVVAEGLDPDAPAY